MRRGFSLIELMISVVLLSLIVSFLYQAVAQLQNSNQKLIQSTGKTVTRENLLKVLYNDFFNAISIKKETKDQNRDMVILQSSNSFYKMSMPYLRYQVSEGTLRRIESNGENLDFENFTFRFDSLVKEVKMFKVYEKNGHFFIYFKAEGMDEIFLDLVPPALGASVSGNENNSTKPEGNEVEGQNSVQ